MKLLSVVSVVIGSLSQAHAFVGPSASSKTSRGDATPPLQMGIFDSLQKAFSNEEFAQPPEGIKATARHILVKSPEQVDLVLEKLNDGAAFASVASDFSTCPSSSQGGSLGSFSPGTMVAEFDKVIFDPQTELGKVVGPVETQFGYHLIVVDKRTGV